MTVKHTWLILGVTRFTPAPSASSYISTINWQLITECGGRVLARMDYTTFGPDHPGAIDPSMEELIALVRDPQLEDKLLTELSAYPEVQAELNARPEPEALPEPETSEIPVFEDPLISNEAPAVEETPPPLTPKRRRARTKKGTYKGDNPATSENEAWEPAQ